MEKGELLHGSLCMYVGMYACMYVCVYVIFCLMFLSSRQQTTLARDFPHFVSLSVPVCIIVPDTCQRLTKYVFND